MADIYAEVKAYLPGGTGPNAVNEFTHSGLQIQVTGGGATPIHVGLFCYSPFGTTGHGGGKEFEVWKKDTDTGTATLIHNSNLSGNGPWTIRATDNGTNIIWSVDGVDKFTDTGVRFETSPYYYPKLHALHATNTEDTLDFDDFTWSDANEPGPAWTDGFGSDSGKWVLAGGTGGTWSLAGGRLRATLAAGSTSVVRWCNRETYFRAPSAPATLYVDSTDAQSGSTNPSDIDLTPVFSAIFDAPDSDLGAGYYIQVSTDSGFSTVTHWDSGWVDQTTADGARCANIAYAGSALSNSQTYYWRIKFKDDHGGYGSAWSTAGTFFTTVEAAAGALEAPDTLYSHSTSAQSGSHNPNGVDLTPVFSAINRCNATATRYNLGVYSDMACQTPLWLSGWTNFVAQPADDARCENIAYGGDTLENCTQYWWRIQMGTAGDTSPWSGEYAFFRHHVSGMDRMEPCSHGS